MELKPAEALESEATSENHKIKEQEGNIDARTRKLMTKELMESKIRGYSGKISVDGVNQTFAIKRFRITESGEIKGRGTDKQGRFAVSGHKSSQGTFSFNKIYKEKDLTIHFEGKQTDEGIQGEWNTEGKEHKEEFYLRPVYKMNKWIMY